MQSKPESRASRLENRAGAGRRFWKASRLWLYLASCLTLCLLSGLRASAVGASLFQAVPDQITYNTGDEVRIRISEVGSGPGAAGPSGNPIRLAASVRYRDSGNTSTHPPTIRTVLYTGSKPPLGYITLWRIPADAAAGRYDVDLEVIDPASGRAREGQAKVASFAVHHQVVRIDRIELDKEFYTSGDPVSVKVDLTNLSGRPLNGLRVEFSDRYWPWIAGPAEQAKASIVPVQTSLDLGVGTAATRSLTADRVAAAPDVKKPSLHQYGVVVWDHDRRQPLQIAFSRTVFINPPGVNSPRPYPPQYVYPDLTSVNLKSYRHFYDVGHDSSAIIFDHARTLYPLGAKAEVSFALGNTTPRPWQAVRVAARLLDSSGKELGEQTVFESLNLDPSGASLRKTAQFQLPQRAGLYRVQVRVTGPASVLLAQNDLELAADDLPKSLLIFCAHEDDEGGWHGMIRAAVENDIPLRLVYFTGGDAGSCDHYYEHFCGPSEALNFGEIRMQESRAVLDHLGVSPAQVLFLGLPDGGSGEIWYRHLQSDDPYRSVLLASDHALYAALAFPNLPYARDAIVSAAAEIIQRFRPEVIVTAHPPAEGHIDHIVNNYFVVKALHRLSAQNSLPRELKLLVDRVYDAKQIPSTPYHYQEHTFYVSGEAAALSQEAGWYYQSQGGNRALGTLRDFGQLPREIKYREVLDWNEHDGWNEKESQSATKP